MHYSYVVPDNCIWQDHGDSRPNAIHSSNNAPPSRYNPVRIVDWDYGCKMEEKRWGERDLFLVLALALFHLALVLVSLSP